MGLKTQLLKKPSMPSSLIVGGLLKERLSQIRKTINQSNFGQKLKRGRGDLKHPDILLIGSKNSIGINQIRQLKRDFSVKPLVANFKISVIPRAENLTIPAQNAMLKILEEPPQDYLIFLSAPSKNQLLPTIVSRCHLIHLQEKPELELDKETLASQLTFLNLILNSSPGKRILLANEIASPGREEAILFCQQLIFISRQLLLKKLKIKKFYPEPHGVQGPHPPNLSLLNIYSILKILSAAQRALQHLRANVNNKLTLENLFLSLPRVGDKIE